MPPTRTDTMDESQEPLISEERPHGEVQHDDEGVAEDAVSDGASESSKGPDTTPGLFVLLLTFAAGISGLLFGYDTGVISATLVSIGTSLSGRTLTSMDKSIITSATALFALVISPFSSILADRFGRKHVILCADLLFIAGALLQAFCSTVALMVVGRCIIGAGVGAASFVVPLYIAEVAPASHRGRLVTTNVLFITLGQMVAYVVGWAFATFGSETTGWRWLVGLGALPAVLQGILVLFMPETPRWLVKAGKSAAAKAVVRKVNGSSVGSRRTAEAIVKAIEIEVREEREASRMLEHQRYGAKWLGAWRELIGDAKHRRSLAVACLLQGLQQLSGFNSLMYFSATIFTIVGFSSPTLTSLTVAVTNFVFTLAALVLIDRIGRRRILLYSIPFMVLGLLLAAFGFSFLGFSRSSMDQTTATEGSTNERAAGLVLVSVMLYVASYALGLGNVPWMQSELFPLSVRSLGSGLATATNWAANFMVGLTFLPLMDALSPSWTFVLYAVVCMIGFELVRRIYPEMAGQSLEGSGVQIRS